MVNLQEKGHPSVQTIIKSYEAVRLDISRLEESYSKSLTLNQLEQLFSKDESPSLKDNLIDKLKQFKSKHNKDYEMIFEQLKKIIIGKQQQESQRYDNSEKFYKLKRISKKLTLLYFQIQEIESSIDYLSRLEINKIANLNLKIELEQQYRRLSLLYPRNREEFEAGLMWMCERGNEEDLMALKKVQQSPPYSSPKISFFFKKALARIKESLKYYRISVSPPNQLSVNQKINLTVELQHTTYTQETIPLPENISELYCFINTEKGLRVIDSEVLTISIEPQIDQPVSVIFELRAYLIGSQTYTIELFTEDPKSDKTSIYKYTDRLIVKPPVATEKFPTILPTLTIPVAPQFTLRVETELLDGDKGSHHLTYYLTSSFPSLKVRQESVGTVILRPADFNRIQSLLNQTIQQVTYLPPEDAREQLISLGQYFFDLFFPSDTAGDFRKVLWQMCDQISTLLIIEDGVTSLPWELVVPYRDDETTAQSFWGEQYHMARWIQGLGTPLYPKIPFGEVALTHYQTLNSEQQQAWEQLLKASNLSNIRQVVHPQTPFYAVHWLREAAELQQQDIVPLEETNPKPSLEREIPQSRLDFRLKRPLVTLSVLNQENTNTENLMLTERVLPFLRAGASTVVGTWWQTSEAAERLFWSQFYDLLETGVTLGEAVWRSRLRVQQALPDRPDWLAYTLFGNPRAKPYQPQDSMGYTALECLNPDEPFLTHKPYYFRASIRMRPPVWYKDSLIQPEELPEDLTAIFLCPDLETPSEAIRMQCVGRTIRHATVPIIASQTGNYVLRVQLFEEEEYLKTLSTTLKVVESTTGEVVNG